MIKPRFGGGGKLPPFVPLDRAMRESEAYLSLGWPARSLLDEFLGLLNPARSNNGALFMIEAFAKGRGFNSKETFRRALLELIDRRLIVVTRQGGRHKASLYGVTVYPLGQDAIKEWLDIDPKCWRVREYLLWRPSSGAQSKPIASAPVALRAA